MRKTRLWWGVAVGALVLAGATGAMVQGCRTTGDCQNGVCACPAGDSCDFICSAPPCHARCDGDNDECNAECANGTCSCGRDSHCKFICQSPPCHVSCSSGAVCSGECANGQCDCGPNGRCDFTCLAGPCHSTCASGATCVVHCPSGTAGTSNCDIVQCAAGTPMICPDGKATTCGTTCP